VEETMYGKKDVDWLSDYEKITKMTEY